MPVADAPTTTTTTTTTSTTAVRVFTVHPSLDALARPRPGARLPKLRENLNHGGTAIGAYFAVLTGPDGASDYPAYLEGNRLLQEADARLSENFGGRYFGHGSTDCDKGAKEALAQQGFRDAVAYIGLYFQTMDEALAFAAGVEPPPLAVASVETFCLD